MYCFSSRVLLDNFLVFSSESGARILRSILVLLGLCSAGFTGRGTPCAVVPSIVGWFLDVAALVVDIGSGMRWLVLLVLIHLALCSLRLSAVRLDVFHAVST